MEIFQKNCRLCLSEPEILISVFDSPNNILLELSTCLSIEISAEDLLPKSVCKKCVDQLHTFYDFYITSKCCEQLLLNRLSSETQANIDSALASYQSDFVDDLKSPDENEILAEFLDSSNNSFDMQLLASDSNALSALEYLTNDNMAVATGNKFTNSNFKVTKITNVQSEHSNAIPDDSYEIHMEIDVLDSDSDIVNELLSKQAKTLPVSSSPIHSVIEARHENYSCMSCKSVFNNFEKLAHHMGNCEALKRTCVHCGSLFETKEKMLKHRSTHNETQTVSCQHCSKTFNGYDRLNQHVEKCHVDFVADLGCVYKCKECGEVCSSKDKLYKHAKAHVNLKMNSNKGKFICDDCGNSYSTRANLLNHKKLKHGYAGSSPGSCVYRCKVCSKIYTDRNQLYVHIKQHTNSFENTQHLCDSCGKSFNSYNTLSRHVLTHVGKQFECNICSRQFINGSLLKKHLGTHEIDTQVCEHCGITLSNEVLLQMHLSEHDSSSYTSNY